MSSVIRYYMVENDTKRTLANQLLVDGSGLVLTGYTVECHMTNTSTDAVTTITSVTPDADQVSNPGLISTEFTSALSEGTYRLEWECTHATTGIVTVPGNAEDRPIMTVRAEAA